MILCELVMTLSENICYQDLLKMKHVFLILTDERQGGYLHIGDTRAPIKLDHEAAALVPDVLFYDNQQVGPSVHA